MGGDHDPVGLSAEALQPVPDRSHSARVQVRFWLVHQIQRGQPSCLGGEPDPGSVEAVRRWVRSASLTGPGSVMTAPASSRTSLVVWRSFRAASRNDAATQRVRPAPTDSRSYGWPSWCSMKVITTRSGLDVHSICGSTSTTIRPCSLTRPGPACWVTALVKTLAAASRVGLTRCHGFGAASDHREGHGVADGASEASEGSRARDRRRPSPAARHP